MLLAMLRNKFVGRLALEKGRDGDGLEYGFGGDGRAVMEVFEGVPDVYGRKFDATGAKGGVDCHEEESSNLSVKRFLVFVVGGRSGGEEVQGSAPSHERLSWDGA